MNWTAYFAATTAAGWLLALWFLIEWGKAIRKWGDTLAAWKHHAARSSESFREYQEATDQLVAAWQNKAQRKDEA